MVPIAKPVIAERVVLEPSRTVERPVMLQGWYNLTSIHWRYDPAVVQALLPEGFTVDTFDGSAWIGLIPFHMRRIRLPFGPNGGIAAGRFSTFPETNVRTYIVRPDGRRAVWFFSLDITRIAPTLVARIFYGLPYCWARMTIDAQPDDPTGTVIRYTSTRRWPSSKSTVVAESRVTIRIGDLIPAANIAPDGLGAFLSARWALGSTFLRRLVWADVAHPTWELHEAELLECNESMVTATGLPPPSGDPIVLWSPGVEVRIGRPTFVKGFMKSG